MALRPWLVLWLVGALVACEERAQETAAQSATANAPQGEAREAILREAELRRDFETIAESDLRSRETSVRRAAARALARLRDDRARPALMAALSDEDALVAAWAAYGLGDRCGGARDETVSALVAAAAARVGEPAAGPLSLTRAITRAIGRCGNERAEAVLAGWARDGDDLAPEAVRGLADIARARKRLREETQVALLGLAEGDASHAPLPEALLPLSRVDHLTPSVITRAREVAQKLIEQGPLAVKVLAKTGDEATPILAEALMNPALSAASRVEAARALAPRGRAGQKLLAQALEKVAITPAIDPSLQVPLAIVEQLTDIRTLRPRLQSLATLSVETKGDGEKRRLSAIRCGAARLLAERRYDMAELRGCDLFVAESERASDPLPSVIGGRAVLDAIGIDGVKLEGARLEAWRAYATKAAPSLRARALEQLKAHDEVRDAPAVLAAALAAAEPGVVAAAAEVITARPARAMVDKRRDEAVRKALLAQLGSQEDIEAHVAVIDAVAALGIEEAKAELMTLCGSARPTLRDHAERALAKLMPTGSPQCRTGAKLEAPAQIARDLPKAVTIRLKTDAGELTLSLDSSLAPAAISRVIALAEGDFFDGIVVHRVVPGFVVQFGSPSADGYGGVKGLPPLPCETSPVPFEAGAVGVALAGRDTGSSQLFVTLGPAPHLDGEYAWLGSAAGAWDAVFEGDVIHDAIVER